jgi:hypothetical protein
LGRLHNPGWRQCNRCCDQSALHERDFIFYTARMVPFRCKNPGARHQLCQG